MNILVIAGYGQDADKSEPHRLFILRSTYFAVDWAVNRGYLGLIYAVGGATNPDFPDRTEAEATLRVLSEDPYGRHTPIICLKEGNTSADTLEAVKKHIIKFGHKIDTLILACETSRSTGFLMDSLYVGLSQLAKQIIVYTQPFPETPEEFENQKKKLLIKLLSHRSKSFHWLRYLYQKRHQKKVAKIKRKLLANLPRV